MTTQRRTPPSAADRRPPQTEVERLATALKALRAGRERWSYPVVGEEAEAAWIIEWLAVHPDPWRVDPPFVVRQFEGVPWVPLHEAARLHDAVQEAGVTIAGLRNSLAVKEAEVERLRAAPIDEHVDVVEIGEAATSALDELDNIRWDDIWALVAASDEGLADFSRKYVSYVRADIERVIAALTERPTENAAPETVSQLVSVGRAAPIDVERLARAMERVEGKAVLQRPGMLGYADVVVAEYAALAAEDAP